MEKSPGFAAAHSRLADSRQGHVTRFAFGLGTVAVLSALAIGFVTHRFAVNATEERYHDFYLSKARTLVAAASMQADHSDDEVLSAIAELWSAAADRPPDEYLCIVDREARVILHTANPAALGIDAGDNLVAGDETRPAGTLRDLVQASQNYVGEYVTSAGQQQIAAFAPVPHRRWVIGIHRSKAALETEIRSGVRLLVIGFLAVCGLLMPASLGLMARTYQIAQRKRRQAEAREIGLGRTLEDSLNEIYIFDASTLYHIEVNRGGRINLGYSMEELVELTPPDLMPDFTRERFAELIRPLRSGEREKIAFRDLVRPDDLAYVQESFNKCINGDGELAIEFRVTWPDETTHWVSARGNVIRAPDGRAVRMLGTVHDIADRKRTEEAIQEKEKQLDNLLSNVGAIVLEGDPFAIYYVGGQVERILGYRKELWFEDPDGPVGFWSKHLHPDDTDKFEICRNAIALGNDHAFEYRMIAADGREVWFYDTVTVETENGAPVKTRSVMVDITERKRMEEALRRSEERLDLAVRGTSDGLWDAELDTGKEYWSPRFMEMLGYGEDEIEASYDQFLALLHPEERADVREALRLHLQENQPYDREFRMQTKGGDYRWFQSRGEALRDKNGRPYRMAGSIRDITDRKQAEKDRLKLEAQLRQSQKLEAIGQLAGGVAHDFNNILTAILCNVEWSMNCVRRELGTDHGVVESMEQIEQAAHRASALTRQLLTFSRRGVMQPKTLDLNHVLANLDKMLRRLITENIALETVTDPESRPHRPTRRRCHSRTRRRAGMRPSCCAKTTSPFAN